jgi:hypothetical protein
MKLKPKTIKALKSIGRHAAGVALFALLTLIGDVAPQYAAVFSILLGPALKALDVTEEDYGFIKK